MASGNGKDWKILQDPDFKKKLRSATSKLPAGAARGLQVLTSNLTSTPIRPGLPTPTPPQVDPIQPDSPRADDLHDESTLNQLSINPAFVLPQQNTSDTDNSIDEDFHSININKSLEDLNMANKDEEIAALKKQLEALEDTRKADLDILEKTVEAQTKLANIKQVQIDDLKKEMENLTLAKDKTTMTDIRKEVAHLHERLARQEEFGTTTSMRVTDKNESLEYNKKKDALRALGAEPDVFDQPTILRSAEDFITQYLKWARAQSDNVLLYLGGLKRFTTGESRTYYDTYVILYPTDVDFTKFSEKFFERFKNLSLAELRKGCAHRKQGADESVRDYGNVMASLMGRSNMSDVMKLEIFITNLKPELQDPVLAAYPSDLTKAITEAERQEAVLKSIKASTQSTLNEELNVKEAEINALRSVVESKNVKWEDKKKEDRYQDRGRSRDRRDDYRSSGRNDYSRERSNSNGSSGWKSDNGSRNNSYERGYNNSRSPSRGYNNRSSSSNDYRRNQYQSDNRRDSRQNDRGYNDNRSNRYSGQNSGRSFNNQGPSYKNRDQSQNSGQNRNSQSPNRNNSQNYNRNRNQNFGNNNARQPNVVDGRYVRQEHVNEVSCDDMNDQLDESPCDGNQDQDLNN